MLWKEVKTWATTNGFKVERLPVDKINNKYEYRWVKNDKTGVEYSTSTLVKVLYNEITSNVYVQHQENYVPSDIGINQN